jgi:hypothetical protein
MLRGIEKVVTYLLMTVIVIFAVVFLVKQIGLTQELKHSLTQARNAGLAVGDLHKITELHQSSARIFFLSFFAFLAIIIGLIIIINGTQRAYDISEVREKVRLQLRGTTPGIIMVVIGVFLLVFCSYRSSSLEGLYAAKLVDFNNYKIAMEGYAPTHSSRPTAKVINVDSSALTKLKGKHVASNNPSKPAQVAAAPSTQKDKQTVAVAQNNVRTTSTPPPIRAKDAPVPAAAKAPVATAAKPTPPVVKPQPPALTAKKVPAPVAKPQAPAVAAAKPQPKLAAPATAPAKPQAQVTNKTKVQQPTAAKPSTSTSLASKQPPAKPAPVTVAKTTATQKPVPAKEKTTTTTAAKPATPAKSQSTVASAAKPAPQKVAGAKEKTSKPVVAKSGPKQEVKKEKAVAAAPSKKAETKPIAKQDKKTEVSKEKTAAAKPVKESTKAVAAKTKASPTRETEKISNEPVTDADIEWANNFQRSVTIYGRTPGKAEQQKYQRIQSGSLKSNNKKVNQELHWAYSFLEKTKKGYQPRQEELNQYEAIIGRNIKNGTAATTRNRRSF